jgi:hypothetical protein
MNEIAVKAKRPTSITVICIIGFVGLLISIPLIFLPTTQQLASWYPLYLAISVVIGAVCMVGLWMMKKWAAYGYTVIFVVNQFILLAAGFWNIMSLVIPAIVIFFILRNVSKMN